jgi:HEAT repeat protein
MRRVAAATLGQIRSAASLAPLAELLKDEDPYTRREAVRAIGSLSGPGVKEALLKALSDGDGMTRIHAAMALSRFGAPEGEKAVVDLLKSPEAQVRQQAANVLGTIATKDVGLPALMKAAAEEKDEALKRQFAFAAQQTRARLGIPEPAVAPK